MKRYVSIALVLAVTVILAGCKSEETSSETIKEVTEASTAKPQTVEVVRADMEMKVSYDAWVSPKVVQLTFLEEGTFGEYKFGVGDVVKEGDIVAVPDTEKIEEEIKSKELELSNLMFNFEYQKQTYENQIKIIKHRMDDLYDQLDDEEYLTPKYTEICVNLGNYDEQKKHIELQIEQLEETYDLELPHCQAQLNKLKEKSTGNVIKAPFDGTIVALHDVEEGETLNDKLYYVAIADDATLYARCEFVGQSMVYSAEKITFWKDGTEYDVSYVPIAEKVYRVMKNSGETIYSEFMIEDTTGAVLSGDYGKIKLVTRHKEQVLIIPEVALLTDANGPYVYRENDGKQERVSVEIGDKDGINVEIVNGLEEGDVIYVQE